MHDAEAHLAIELLKASGLCDSVTTASFGPAALVRARLSGRASDGERLVLKMVLAAETVDLYLTTEPGGMLVRAWKEHELSRDGVLTIVMEFVAWLQRRSMPNVKGHLFDW